MRPIRSKKKDGTTEFRLGGKLHRENGPALYYPSGTVLWYYKGKNHRVNGPAIIHSDGSTKWYRSGKLHRKGGPAVETMVATEWYKHGKRHREDGPAVAYFTGNKRWFINDNDISNCMYIFEIMEIGRCSINVATRVWNSMQIHVVLGS